MALFRNDERDGDNPGSDQRTRDREVIVHDKGGGGGWLVAILLVALLAVVLWAVGIFDIDLYGDSADDSLRGGAEVELTPPEDQNGGGVQVQ